MVSHSQLPPHPSRLLPVQKERRPGYTEARTELLGIQTAWKVSLSQHRPLASHTSTETGWNRQAGRSLCRRPVGRNVCFPSRVPYLPAYFPELRRESEGFTPGKGTCCHTPFTAQTPPEPRGCRAGCLLACALYQVFNMCALLSTLKTLHGVISVLIKMRKLSREELRCSFFLSLSLLLPLSRALLSSSCPHSH